MINIFNLDLKLLELIILVLFGLCFFFQLFYYFFFYGRLAYYKPDRGSVRKKPVSVIICARDEAPNLRKYLPSILNQDYIDYEVIVVNDCSEDETKQVLESFSKKHKHLKVSTIKKDKKFSHGKKFALFIGIKAAKNEWLLLTDADCSAVSDQWLSTMQKNFRKSISFVLGYGGYKKEKGILNRMIRYDTVFIAMQYFGFALAGIPYMGVGRNLAYRRSLFFDNRGFSKHMHLNSGDDDLFVNANANKSNTLIEVGKKSHICSVPKSTFSEWAKQKQRHLTTAVYYKNKDKFLLFIEPFSRVIFYTTLILLLIQWFIPEVVIGAFLFRTIFQLTFFKFAMVRLNEKDLLLSSFLFDILAPFYNLYFTLLKKTAPN
ncbi:MAG: glycosyltransferase [Bacteroidetes bacterium]|nr:glycosyltransferase [Bacteroidota bacterium]